MAARTSCVFLRRAGRSAKNKGIIINCNSPTWGKWREHHEIPQIVSVPDKNTENERCKDLDICLVSNPKQERRIEFTGEVYRVRGLTEMMKKLSLGEQKNVRSARGNHLTQVYCADNCLDSTMSKLTLCELSPKKSENPKQNLRQKEKDDLKKRLDKLSEQQRQAKKKLAEAIARKLAIERSNFERLLAVKRTDVQDHRKVKRQTAMNKVRSNSQREKTSFQVKAPESKRKIASGTKRASIPTEKNRENIQPNQQTKFRRIHRN